MKSLLNLDITSRNLKKAVEDKENKLPSRFSFYNKVKDWSQPLDWAKYLLQNNNFTHFLWKNLLYQIADNQEQIFILDFYSDKNREHFEFGALFTTGFFIDTYLKSKKPWFLNIDFTYNLPTDKFIVLFFGATDELGFYPLAGDLWTRKTLELLHFFWNGFGKRLQLLLSTLWLMVLHK